MAIPLALATVVGGIDCTESAASVGDDYPTGQIIAAEGLATVVGGLFGGVIQSTPYIGHPAYKAMGAGPAYTLATALFVGGAGVFGYFDWIFYLLPKAVVFPILIFVGLEITAQSFHATPIKHYPAVALACVPALAYLAVLALNQVLPEPSRSASSRAPTRHWIQTVTILSGGFIVTSLLWGSILTHLIDGRLRPAVVSLFLAGACALFGVIHSPLPSGPIVTPERGDPPAQGARPVRGLEVSDPLPLGRRLLGFGRFAPGSRSMGQVPRAETRERRSRWLKSFRSSPICGSIRRQWRAVPDLDLGLLVPSSSNMKQAVSVSAEDEPAYISCSRGSTIRGRRSCPRA